jgi:hypothetical protein
MSYKEAQNRVSKYWSHKPVMKFGTKYFTSKKISDDNLNSIDTIKIST